MRLLHVAILSLALLSGCATTPTGPNPAQYEALATFGITMAIERSKDPIATAKLVRDLIAMPGIAQGTAGVVRERISYATLTPSQQVAVDALLTELDRQVSAAVTIEDRNATLDLWRRAASAAASKFLP
jgi:hypothetical protein